MIHNRVIVVFQPARGSAADAINAANQQVFIDLTPGTMTAARTNANGLLVSATGTPVPLDDSRDYSVHVLPLAAATAPPPTTAARVRLSADRLPVEPQIAIHVTDSAGRAAARLAFTLAIGATNISVTTGLTGWILSNEQSTGPITLTSADRLLRLSSAPVPSLTLNLASTPAERGSTARINAVAPAGAVSFRVMEWRYALSHANPNGRTVTAAITRPQGETSVTFHQFWEGTICASGEVQVRFVTGCTVRPGGTARVSETVVAMDPQTAALALTVNARPWATTLNQHPESDFTGPINRFEDLGGHRWTHPNVSASTQRIISGPNRGCEFVERITGVAFASNPQVNASVSNLGSPFQNAQGRVYVLAPPAVRGQIVPPSFYTVGANGTVHVPNGSALASHLGVADPSSIRVTNECIAPGDLLTGVRVHEHLGPISHKQNCLRALRALEPAVYIEAFVDAPGGGRLNFATLLQRRMMEVLRAEDMNKADHREVDEAATRSAGALRFTSSMIPDVNLDSAGNRRDVWNPATNALLTN